MITKTDLAEPAAKRNNFRRCSPLRFLAVLAAVYIVQPAVVPCGAAGGHLSRCHDSNEGWRASGGGYLRTQQRWRDSGSRPISCSIAANTVWQGKLGHTPCCTSRGFRRDALSRYG